MRWSVAIPCLLALAAPLLLSGCTAGQGGSFSGGQVATVSGQGYKSGVQSKDLECGEDALVSYGAQGVGTMRVTVTDGAGAEQYDESTTGSSQEGAAETLHGAPGKWTLRVSMGFGYSGQYAITLTC